MSQQENQPRYSGLVQVATLSVALLMYTTSMTTPALAEIAKAFPDVSGETIKLIGSIPSLMLCIFSLVSGWLATKISIKKCILIASAFIFVGILPAFFGDMNFILFTRVVFGAGYGMIFPLASAVVTDLFVGEQRSKLMGWKSAVGAAAGVVFQLIGGILAVYSWRYVFFGFLVVIPIIILVYFALPETEVKKVGKSQNKSVSNGPKKFTNTLYICALVGLLLNTVQFSFMQNMAMFVSADNIGSAQQAGNILSVFTASSFVAGLMYVYFARISKNYTPAIAILFIGCAFAVGLNANSLMGFYLSAIIFGIGFGFINPSLTLKAASGVTDKTYTPMAISIYACSTGIGQFLSAYVLLFIRNIFNMTSTRADWQISAITISLGAVIGIITIFMLNKKQKVSA